MCVCACERARVCLNIFFTSTPCLSSSLLPSSFIIIYLLTSDEDFVSKALAFNCSLSIVV